jgi:hypothetical protein
MPRSCRLFRLQIARFHSKDSTFKFVTRLRSVASVRSKGKRNVRIILKLLSVSLTLVKMLLK